MGTISWWPQACGDEGARTAARHRGCSRELLFHWDFCHPLGMWGLKPRKIPSRSHVHGGNISPSLPPGPAQSPAVVLPCYGLIPLKHRPPQHQPPWHHPTAASPLHSIARAEPAWLLPEFPSSPMSWGRLCPPLTHPAGGCRAVPCSMVELETWSGTWARAGRPVAGGAAPTGAAQPSPGLSLEHPWVLPRLSRVVTCLSQSLRGVGRAQLGQIRGTRHPWIPLNGATG